MSNFTRHISDDQIAALPSDEVVHAVEETLQALARGEVQNPPREETLGRDGDPDFFRLDFASEQRDERGDVRFRCRKIIEEAGASDGAGRRALGSRRAWIEFEDCVRRVTISLDAEVVTNVRTAVSALLGARYLMPPGPVRVGLVGTGRIARQVLRYATAILDIELVSVTSRSAENRARVVAEIQPEVSFPVHAAGSVRDCIGDVDVVIAAVPSSEPVLRATECSHAGHISLVGGDPRVVLADRALWETRRVVVDNADQARKSGDLVVAEREGWLNAIGFAPVDGREATLADAAVGRLSGLKPEPTMLLLTGIGALDMAVARLAYERLV